MAPLAAAMQQHLNLYDGHVATRMVNNWYAMRAIIFLDFWALVVGHRGWYLYCSVAAVPSDAAVTRHGHIIWLFCYLDMDTYVLLDGIWVHFL